MHWQHFHILAILNKNSINVHNCTLYVALFPCNECAKIIIQSRIKEVVYLSDKHADKPQTIASKKMLDAAKIAYRQFKPRRSQIIIDFNKIDENWIPFTKLRIFRWQ